MTNSLKTSLNLWLFLLFLLWDFLSVPIAGAEQTNQIANKPQAIQWHTNLTNERFTISHIVAQVAMHLSIRFNIR